MSGKTVVIMDSLNGLVWVDGQKSAGPVGSVKYYGKDARRFDSQREVRKYAYILANKYSAPIYDKYLGTYIRPVSVTKRKLSSHTKPKNRERSIFGI